VLAEDRKLHLWIKAPKDAALLVDAGDGAKPPQGTDVQGGQLVKLELREGVAAVTVSASRAGASSTFRLPIAPAALDLRAGQPELTRLDPKQLDQAAAELRSFLTDPRVDVQVQAKRKIARIERLQRRPERAAQMLEEVLAIEREQGWISEEIEDRFVIAYCLAVPQLRLTEARRVLDALAAIEVHDPGRVGAVVYLRGVIAHLSGDLRAALTFYRDGAARGERLGRHIEHADALMQLVDTLALLGRYREAEAMLQEVKAALPADARPCDRARFLINIGLFTLHARDIGHVEKGLSLPDPIGAFEGALGAYEHGCKNMLMKANLLAHFAHAELQRGRPGDARRWLAQVLELAPKPGLQLATYRTRLEGQILLSEGRAAEALQWFERLDALGKEALLPETRFEGAFRRAQALEALGRKEQAQRAYLEAEEQIDAWSQRVPLGEGRDTFFARFEQITRIRVESLLERSQKGALEQATNAARRSQGRMLAALGGVERISSLPPEARAGWEGAIAAYRRKRTEVEAKSAGDWKLSKKALEQEREARSHQEARLRAVLDEALSLLGSSASDRSFALYVPAKDELLLVYHPLREGWVGFAITDTSVEAKRLGSIDVDASAEQLADALLRPFEAKLGEAQRIRISTHGPLGRRDLHALPFRGLPLVAHAPVVYALDLPPRAADEARAADGSPPDAGAAGQARAVLIADPRGDLPAARREAAAVTDALGRAGFALEPLAGATATHAAVRGALEQPLARLVHYAGHGVFGGQDGWESGLLLARGESLTIGDIMTLRRVPPRIILSGCETARNHANAPVAGLGLAQAFLVAGAESVVAATRPIEDRLAEQIFAGLYKAKDRGPDALLNDPAAALRSAQMAAYESGSSADWASFRVLVR